MLPRSITLPTSKFRICAAFLTTSRFLFFTISTFSTTTFLQYIALSTLFWFRTSFAVTSISSTVSVPTFAIRTISAFWLVNMSFSFLRLVWFWTLILWNGTFSQITRTTFILFSCSGLTLCLDGSFSFFSRKTLSSFNAFLRTLTTFKSFCWSIKFVTCLISSTNNVGSCFRTILVSCSVSIFRLVSVPVPFHLNTLNPIYPAFGV